MGAEKRGIEEGLEVGQQIGRRIAHLRTKRSWSRSELAERLGISRDSVGKLERGVRTPSPEVLIRLSVLFAVSLDELMTGRRSRPEDAITGERLARAAEHLQGLAKALGMRKKDAKTE